MTSVTTILVPIRYPLTEQSTRTLAAAGRLAQDNAPAELRVLHVNLYHTRDSARTTELTHAISATLDGVKASVVTRRGFLVEEVILDEATDIDADFVVVGASPYANWRHYLRRVLGNGPRVGPYLREQTSDSTQVLEVDAGSDTPTVRAA